MKLRQCEVLVGLSVVSACIRNNVKNIFSIVVSFHNIRFAYTFTVSPETAQYQFPTIRPRNCKCAFLQIEEPRTLVCRSVCSFLFQLLGKAANQETQSVS